MLLNKNTHKLHKWTMGLAALANLLFLGGCESERGRQAMSAPVPEVATVTIQTERVVLTKELPGRTSPYRVCEVRPQVNGIIQKRLFTEGADVKAGDVLYQIDPAPFQAALDNSKAALGRSEAGMPALRSRAERFRELLADKGVSRQDYDDAAAALKQSQADIQYWKAMVETARINLGYTSVKAPISGRIGKSNVTEGALATAQQPLALATIQQLNPMFVDVPQSTTEMLHRNERSARGRLKTDGEDQRKVKLILKDGAEYSLEGTLQFRDVTVDPATGSVILRMVFPNPESTLLPGMYVRAVVQEGIAEEAILAPQQGVTRDPRGNPVALIVDDAGKVQQRVLMIDRAIGNQWLVVSGLKAGERLIVEGMMNVRPGAAVKVIPSKCPSGESS
ncbi:MAG: Multidrug resistance protein MexA precursor [Syntrophaceae bacterium PtaB.Bin095]|nr:MAG: Multidrug resistance protein MexA precursor [Syntrophaceae bacterium PtaB.Bin095]